MDKTSPTMAEVDKISPTSSEKNGSVIGSGNSDPKQGEILTKSKSIQFRLRPENDDEQNDWWFCSTAIPLIAATTGPLANVMSIAALVTSWRNNYDPANPGIEADSIGFPDPHWCLALNGASLACGFVGNLFLLFNFTKKVRYIVALPMTIFLWYLATGILIGITTAMHVYVPPKSPDQLYSQGYWHAVIAAILYMVSSMLLMLNMLGYFLGHYPQHFELTDEQRNLILQTMMFFIWLAGGGAVFAKVEGWSFVDSLYFCDVTILTVGFGDFHPINDAGRGLVFPYSVGGIIILGLMVSSIHKFANELSSNHVIQKHVEKQRTWTINRSVTSEQELEQRRDELKKEKSMARKGKKPVHPTISALQNPRRGTIVFEEETATTSEPPKRVVKRSTFKKVFHGGQKLVHRRPRKPKLLMLKEERDRFNQMREIQRRTNEFKKYSALTMSIIAFGILWCIGAVGFWQVEAHTQGLSYFQALYFCYVSLLTIGYGDLSPTSNAGKPLFIVWSLIAVPTMTILISDMGETVIASFKRGTFTLADWTVLPKEGIWRAFVEKHPKLLKWIQTKQQERDEEKRLHEGFKTGPTAEEEDPDLKTTPPTLEEVAKLDTLSDKALVRRLAGAIRRAANDLGDDPPRTYTYEEWAEFTRLIRFSRLDEEELAETEEDEGLIEWDWIGEESPMMAKESESQWVLDRLCESLNRYMRKKILAEKHLGPNSATMKDAAAADGSSVSSSASSSAGESDDDEEEIEKNEKDTKEVVKNKKTKREKEEEQDMVGDETQVKDVVEAEDEDELAAEDEIRSTDRKDMANAEDHDDNHGGSDTMDDKNQRA